MPQSTDQPLVPLAWRRAGVRNGGGTARDVVVLLVRSRPRISLTPGTGLPRGRSVPLRARGLDSSARRPVPRAVPPGRLAVRTGEVSEGRVDEVTGGPLYRDRVGGTGTGTAGLAATIRVPSDRDPARRVAETRSFGAAKKEVLALAGWLRSWQVPAVVTEATGDYWKVPFCRPRPARSPVRQARRTRQGQERQPVPGRHHRPDRRGSRPDPDPRRRPPPATGPQARHGPSVRRHREHPAEGLPAAG